MRLRPHLLPLLRLRVWLGERFKPTELQTTLMWAGLVGFFGALSSLLFRELTTGVHYLLTHSSKALVDSFYAMPPWQRALTPMLGGALAGTTIFFGMRFARSKSTDYMEAIVLGEGNVPFRSSLVKSASALFTIATGGSIGREGPLVQLAAMVASLPGRFRKWPAPRRRLIVACGAAAGIASAYNAPIAGALFVAEIVLGSVAMESFGPLVFASVIATMTVRGSPMIGDNPLYRVPAFRLNASWEILPYAALGVVAGMAAPWFLRFLRLCETWFEKSRLPLTLRLALGGAMVGGLAILHPEVAGNGYSSINDILQSKWTWEVVLGIFACKVLATGATFGSGAVGGVFTPTLFTGCGLGYLIGCGFHALWPHSALMPSAFALVGMGAFLAATTHAPLMAMLMVFEITLDYAIILPLMLGCVIAYYLSIGIEPASIYSESLKRKGARLFDEQLSNLRVLDLMKTSPPVIPVTAEFNEIAQNFISHRFNYLYVVDADRHFLGVVSLHDIKPYLNEPEMADVIIAEDILREDFPTVTPNVPLAQALEYFAHHDGERLPVLEEGKHTLLGSVSKSDLILAIADRAKAESAPSPV
ncbi:MAG TPA: ClcB-like voltage-gated chloride channel protein [Chthoniobacteraceae bacterium]|nr:ClcB-like voltage-gated chloride channel protein [Chthoniobacteraceae bacterium]